MVGNALSEAQLRALLSSLELNLDRLAKSSDPQTAELAYELQNTIDKIRAELPNMVTRYHSHIVGSHGEIEHADPTQTHTLVEFEAIGNVAKNSSCGGYAPAGGGFRSARGHG